MSSVFPEKIILKPKIFFGKILFFDVINPEDPFVIQEWYRFNAFANYESVEDCSCDKVFQGKKNKGSIDIGYVPTEHKLKRLKLRWNETENKWKIVQNFHSLNRLANIDIISGSKSPDFRLSLKTHYEIPSEGSKVEEVINNIQSAKNFTKKNGMWFRSKDFDNTIIKKAVVRQVIEKKRFKNENFFITFKTIKEDKNNIITIEKSITLKHHTWNQEINLDNVDVFMKSVIDTILYVRKMLNALV
ncbi:hypothetical protein C1645_844598 [Glomus cerebriforme]|uniref:Uncharacterized protein n=1 Tax=Glomus cerebriforme TaxID=658196 RepID=A0A397T9A6_9GLOM|nr:hypothetical protein C1645_844598 [Glomus cerebriforme]